MCRDLQLMDWSSVKVLEVGKSIETFIDEKIKERDFEGSEVPFYVGNIDIVVEKHQRWQAFLPRVTPFYAVKCNNTPVLLRTLSALGTGFDCASKREIEMVLSIGVTPDKIIYAHTTKPNSHIRYACTQGVDFMTFDNEEELIKISTAHPNAKLLLRIEVDDSKSQINLNTKFGSPLAAVEGLLKQARKLNLDVTGVSFHVGSVCMDSCAYQKAIADARSIFDQATLIGFQMDLLDIGGGFTGNTLQTVSKGINEALDEFFPADCGVRIIAEPGRYFVDTAFTLAMNVFAKKKMLNDTISHKDGSDLNAVIMYYVTDGLFGSLHNLAIYPDIWTIFLRPNRPVDSREPQYQSVVWGPTCDSADRIIDGLMPELNVGDWLLVDNSGAYTIPLMTDFNGFEKADIYLAVTSQCWKMLKLKATKECFGSICPL